MWVIVIAVFVIYYLLQRPFNFWKNRGIRQCRPWPLFGDSWGMVFRLMDFAEMVSFPYKLIPNVRYYGIYQFTKPKLVIRDPELIKSITVKDFDHFVDHVAMVDPQAEPLFAKNLLSLKGDEWRKMRSTLTGAFTSSKMKIMFNLITEATENFAEFFRKQEDEIVQFEAKDAFSRFTIDVIATTSFGIKVDSMVDRNNDFFRMGKEIAEPNLSIFLRILLFRICPPFYRFLKIGLFRKGLNDFFRTLVNETISVRETVGTYRPDMLQILIDARKKSVDDKIVNEDSKEKSKMLPEFTNDDITAQALIFFFAGFDSVSSLMTFTSYELAVNQDVQNKLREEIMATLKKFDGKITYEAVSNMEYMDMVTSETLRKWPPFVLLGRECTKTYIIEPTSPEEKTLVIPKGMGIQIPVYAIHHDPLYHPNPEKFIPERYSLQNKNELTPCTSLGFGQGPRNCIGSRFALLEVKTLFFYLLNSFQIVPISKTQIPLKLSKKFSVNIRPENGLWLGLKRL